MRTGNSRYLAKPTSTEALSLGGLTGTYANLCLRFGLEVEREAALEGMRLAAANKRRWEALTTLLTALASEGVEPVLFKGGAMHARWPAMRDVRALFDYDLIVPQRQATKLRALLAAQGFETAATGSRLTQRLSKGWMVWKGSGLGYQNLDIHSRVTEPPVCSSLTRSILATRERADGIRVPDIEDCVCMIALHIVRSGMYRPLREYIDLLWYVDGMDASQWNSLCVRARRHHLIPALFLSLRQARFCLALEELAPQRAASLSTRIAELERTLGHTRRRMLDWLAPSAYPLDPIATRNRPLFRRSFILGAGTNSAWRVAAAFLLFGATRLGDQASFRDRSTSRD